MEIKEILKNLTLTEKLQLLTGYDGFSALRMPEKGLNGVQMADGPYGVKTKDGESTCFLNTCLMASSWDRESCYEIGKELGAECKKFGVDVLLSPAINIKRHPLCGRNFEYYSEDPVLTGVLASQYVKGIRSEGTATCVKHYACYSQEDMRWELNCYVDDDTLRNTYLKAFEIVLKDAGSDMIMAAYPRINEVPATENSYLLKDILRDEWGYDGVVVSDWCAVSDLASAFENGLDLEMPGNVSITLPVLQKAVAEGRLTEAEIDEKVLRLLRLAKTAEEKPVTTTKTDGDKIRKLTGEAFVLLKNENVLPLTVSEKTLLIGKGAKTPKIQGGGCAKMKTKVVLSPFEELQKLGARCECEESYTLSQEALNGLASYDKIVVFLMMDEDSDSEAFDRTAYEFPQEQIACLETVSRYNENIIVVMQNGSAVDMSFVKYAKGVLETYYAGSYGGGALADVLLGKTNPSGRLAESFPVSLKDTPAYENFGKQRNIVYAEREFVGYKYYTSYGVKPAYPFGFGLSYGKCEIENISVTEKGAYTYEVQFEVFNDSAYEVKETVQIYLRSNERFQPKMQLLDFCKVPLQAGERKRCSVLLQSENFQRYTGGKKRLLQGEYAICVARSSEKIIAEYAVHLENEVRRKLDRETPLGLLLTDEKCRPIVWKYLLPAIKIWAYGDKEADGDFEKDEFLCCSVYSMPIRSFLYFSDEGKFDEETMERLLDELAFLQA